VVFLALTIELLSPPPLAFKGVKWLEKYTCKVLQEEPKVLPAAKTTKSQVFFAKKQSRLCSVIFDLFFGATNLIRKNLNQQRFCERKGFSHK